MEIGNIAEHNKGFRYLLNCIDIYTVCKKTKMEEFFNHKILGFCNGTCPEFRISNRKVAGSNPMTGAVARV